MTLDAPSTAGIAGTVTSVHDGDTLTLTVDTLTLLGVEGQFVFHVRLLGINAPELNTPAGKKAAGWLKAKAEGKGALLGIAGPDKYGGRVDGRVWLSGEADDLSAQLIAEGLAKPWDGKGARP